MKSILLLLFLLLILIIFSKNELFSNENKSSNNEYKSSSNENKSSSNENKCNNIKEGECNSKLCPQQCKIQHLTNSDKCYCVERR
jgi:hypothetical protein